MLDRTSISAPLPRAATDSLRQALLTGPTSMLIRFTAILMLVSALACVYLWQVSQVSALNSRIAAVRAKTARLEREQASLVLDVAKWSSPAYVERKSREMGLVSGTAPIRVRVLPANDQTKTTDDRPPTLAERLRSWLGSSVLPTVDVRGVFQGRFDR